MAYNFFKKTHSHSSPFLLYGLLVAFLVFSWSSRTESAQVVDRIVAVVNDDIITLFELNRALRPYSDKVKELGYLPEREQEMLFKVRQNILDKLVSEKIRDQEVKRLKIKVAPSEIDQTIERVKELNLYTDEDLRAALAKDGVTMEDYRGQIEEQMLRTKLVNLEIKSKIVITREDIKNYYESHPEKYGGEKQYHLKNIIMSVPPFTGEIQTQQIQKRMEEAYGKLKDGEPFENIVAAYSESPLAAEGGDLGLFGLDSLSPALREAVKDMKPGEFTPVLDTDQGYQIFLVEDIVKTKGKALEDVSAEIESTLFNEIVNRRFQSWLEELRKKSHIKIIN